MSIVYAIQNPHHIESGRLEPKFDFSSAKEYGELRFLLLPNVSPFSPGPVIQELREKLVAFTAHDLLLLVGNPILIGWAVSIAAQIAKGSVTCLQWHGRERRYIPVSANLNLGIVS